MRADSRLDSLLASLEQHHALPTIALGVDRVVGCLARLGNPQDALPPVVHIAGTNGKGSTQAMLRALLEAQGKSVHCYTSPHLVRFHERIVVCGKDVESDVLLDALERVTEAAGEDIPLTFFEATTIAAFLCFAETPADILLLEVGLGGRLDATNVVTTPLLSVITPIDYDHKEFLGDTLEQIAMEKAGIMKPEVPVVSAEQYTEVERILHCHARTLHAPFTVARRGEGDIPSLSLAGRHQQVNAACALAAYAIVAKALGLPPAPVEGALARTVWRGRLQHITRGPLVGLLPETELWLDGGHNPAAATVLAGWIQDRGDASAGLVVGMMKRKDIAGFLEPFLGLGVALATVGIDTPDAASAEAIQEEALRLGFRKVRACGSLEEALRWHGDAPVGHVSTILICGSLYLAGKVLQNHA